MTRYKRMRGYKALWVPGADHAGFETQIVYEKKLEKEGRSRFGMDPQDLYKEIYDFTIENKKYMEDEVKRMGASCDWSREKFTLDPDVVVEVQKTFEKMYHDKLVFRGKRIINWCPKHQTTLSDVETTTEEKQDKFYYLQYGPFVIATARPETKFGDKYVVMHPDDTRYAQYKHGDTFEAEWINGPITATIIKDDVIDMEFGTGVMTITPWHDTIDFAIAERHNLPKEQVIDFRGKLLDIAGEFAGMKIAEARPKIIEKLEAKGLLVKVEENYKHNVPCCYKCNTVIEPQVMDQWFVKNGTTREARTRCG
jgi:valyl-tRNA synthetase